MIRALATFAVALAATTALRAAAVAGSGRAVAYYVDARSGHDASSGTSPQAAWRSLARVNRAAFRPGDRLLLAGGQTFRGTLRFTMEDSGRRGRPITVGSDDGGPATIDAGAGHAFVLDGCAHVTVRDLRLVGRGRNRGSHGAGLELRVTRHVHADRIEAAGFRLGGVRARGIEDTRLTRIDAHDNGFAGISIEGAAGGRTRSKRLYLGDCRAENNPGDPENRTNHSGSGIVVAGVDEALVEYCAASNNGWDMPRDGNGPVGIWGWDCDRLTIQRCISHHNKSPGLDGGGFDLDGGVTNSVMQYNLSYENAGTGYLLCQYPGAKPWKDNVVRYNLSVEDGAKHLQSGIGLWQGGAGMAGAEVYHNTIVNSRHAVQALNAVPGIVCRNNVFLAGEEVLVGDFSQTRFENNLYWSTGRGAILRHDPASYRTLQEWAAATGQEKAGDCLLGLFADPRLALPDTGQSLPTDPHQLATMPFYRLLPGSPCAAAGTTIRGNGSRDFFQTPLPATEPPSLGASQH
jgi:hypothetical protein